jgi:predicted acylesterase/phospholipase RssA
MAPASSKTALVLAGGGIMGAAYEIGALTALDRLFAPGFSNRRFDMYVGISAGSVIAALIANRIPPATLFESVNNDDRRVFNWRRSDIYQVDRREILASAWQVARNTFRIWRTYRRNRWDYSLSDFFHIVQEQFPAGLFSLEPMEQYLCRSFKQEGLVDAFDQLSTELYIPAYDLDYGRRAVFGTAGFNDMHICQAITASCAIPYFFRPHRVGEQYYVDGSVGQVLHLDIAIERGAKLVVVVNPRVPMQNDRDSACLPSLSTGRCSSIAELGISIAREQSLRVENHEKLALELELCRSRHPEVDIVLIEPGPEETLLFFQSPMSQASRTQVMNYGLQLTLGQLQSRFDELQTVFARHGIRCSSEQLAAGRAPEPSSPAPA